MSTPRSIAIAIALVALSSSTVLGQEQPTPNATPRMKAQWPEGMATGAVPRSRVLTLPAPPLPAATPAPSMRCVSAVEKGLMTAAVVACRQELAASPASLKLITLSAQAELAAGDPRRSAELWQQLLQHEGWNEQAARGKAMALHRAGEVAAAEEVLRKRVLLATAPAPHIDLVDFLISANRNDEAILAAKAGLNAFPDHCRLLEGQGVAEAGRNHDKEAAALFGRRVASGCPRYGWASRGVLVERFTDPAYRALLAPDELVEGLADLGDDDCMERFRLLRPVLTADTAAAVTDEVLRRRSADVRVAGVSLLGQLGAGAAGPFGHLLATGDRILRTRTLREIHQLHDPAFIPVLETYLEREPLPPEATSAQLVLGDLLFDGGRAADGERMLSAIPAQDPLYPEARLLLAQRAEQAGDMRAARRLVEQARIADPTIWVDPTLLKRIGLPAPGPAS